MKKNNVKACCPKCFADHLLFRCAEGFAEAGCLEVKCLRCGSEGKGFEPILLRPQFEDLFDAYEEVVDSGKGKPLHLLFQEDWKIFVNDDIAEGLVYEILPEAKGKIYLPVGSDNDYAALWDSLKKEIKGEYRYCFSQDLFSEKIQSVFSQLEETIDCEQNWFRARISEEKLKSKDMGAPPFGKARAGRANPVGIPYLYLAENEETAVTEVRPHKGATVYVGKFKPNEELHCLDLTDPISRISPFFGNESLTIEELRSVSLFFKSASLDLSMPISPDVASVNYVPTQVLCEFIKKSGYAGVIYRSAYTNSRNLVVFDEKNLRVLGKIIPHEITEFRISHSPRLRR